MVMRWIVILTLLILSASSTSGQETEIPHEYLVKSKYLLNIPLFTEISSKTGGTSYIICLAGETPLESILASSKGIMIKNLPLSVRKVEELSQVGSCQMLFIASSERYRLQKRWQMLIVRGL